MAAHGHDHHVKIIDTQQRQYLGLGDVGALAQGEKGGGGIHHLLVAVHGQYVHSGGGQLAGYGKAVTTQTEYGVRFMNTHRITSFIPR